MDRIAPLAKILAEANGIDWQKMQGSGAGGQIVEQDILNYLSRVMSGEEDPPDTPVDLPPPDWNGEEVPTADMLGRAGMSADMLSRAGVDTDLTAFVEQTRAAAPAQVTGSPSSTSLDEDALEFELEDEEPAHVAPVHTPEVAAPAFSMPAPEVTAAPSFEAPAPAVAEMTEPEPVEPTPSEPTLAAPEPVAVAEPEPVAAPVQPEVPAAAAAPAAAGGLAAGLGSLLSRLYQKPAEAPAPAPEPTPAPVTHTPATPDMPEVEAPATAWTDGRQAADAAWAQPADEVTEPAVPTEMPAEAPVAEPEPVAAQAEESAEDMSTGDTSSADTSTGTPDVAAAPVEAEPEAVEPLAADPVAAELPAAEPVSAEPVVAEPEPVSAEPVAAQADVAEPQAAQPELETPAVSEPEVAPPVAAVPAPVAPAAAMPPSGVWFGAYLRRDADVAALHDLRGQVTAALSRDLPLALLVARAAQRHADTLGLGSVAVHADGGALSAGSGSLRDALDAGAFGGTPDLLVVDAGAMDLDDLHFPHTTTLSVGRVQGGRAALTLNGDVDAARAAQFLAQVAGTLEQPILLVL